MTLYPSPQPVRDLGSRMANAKVILKGMSGEAVRALEAPGESYRDKLASAKYRRFKRSQKGRKEARRLEALAASRDARDDLFAGSGATVITLGPKTQSSLELIRRAEYVVDPSDPLGLKAEQRRRRSRSPSKRPATAAERRPSISPAADDMLRRRPSTAVARRSSTLLASSKSLASFLRPEPETSDGDGGSTKSDIFGCDLLSTAGLLRPAPAPAADRFMSPKSAQRKLGDDAGGADNALNFSTRLSLDGRPRQRAAGPSIVIRRERPGASPGTVPGRGPAADDDDARGLFGEDEEDDGSLLSLERREYFEGSRGRRGARVTYQDPEGPRPATSPTDRVAREKAMRESRARPGSAPPPNFRPRRSASPGNRRSPSPSRRSQSPNFRPTSPSLSQASFQSGGGRSGWSEEEDDDDEYSPHGVHEMPTETSWLAPPPAMPLQNLTHRVVPRARDAASAAGYCGACTFLDCERCSYCMHSKLSKTRRLPLDRLATLLVQRQPVRFAKDAKLLGYTLGRYAKSDDFVEKTHVKLLGLDPGGSRKFDVLLCEEHEREHDQVVRLERERDGYLGTAMKLKREVEALHRHIDSHGRNEEEKETYMNELELENTRLKGALALAHWSRFASNKEKKFLKLRLAAAAPTWRPQYEATTQTENYVRVCSTQTEEAVKAVVRTTDACHQVGKGHVQDAAPAPEATAAPAPAEEEARRRAFGAMHMMKGQPIVPQKLERPFSKLRTGKAELIHKDQLQTIIYEIYEKKCEADVVAGERGHAPIPFDRHLREYWRRRAGLKDVARKKIKATIRSADAHGKDMVDAENPRIVIFRTLCGLDDGRPYSMVTSQAFFGLANAAWRGELKHMSEDLGQGPCVVGRRRILEALDLDEPLKLLLSPCKRSALRSAIGALAERAPQAARHKGRLANGIDFDEAAKLLLAACQDAITTHAAKLAECFTKYDKDGGGSLDAREFSALVEDVVGRDALTMDERLALFHKIEDDVDGNDDDDDEIENGLLFADALLATTCPLATPAACKNYWAEDREFEPLPGNETGTLFG